MSSAERVASSVAPDLGAELGDRLHGQPAVAVREQVEAGVAVAIGEFLEDLGEIGRVLLLQQVQQIGGGPDAQEASNGVEDEIDSALRRHGKRFTLARQSETLPGGVGRVSTANSATRFFIARRWAPLTIRCRPES